MINKEKKYNINLFDLIEKDINENLELYFEKILEIKNKHFNLLGIAIYFSLKNRQIELYNLILHTYDTKDFDIYFVGDEIKIKFEVLFNNLKKEISLSNLKKDLLNRLIEVKKEYLHNNKKIEDIIFNIDSLEDLLDIDKIPVFTIFNKEEFKEELDIFIDKTVNHLKHNNLSFDQLKKRLLFFYKNKKNINLIYYTRKKFNLIYYSLITDIFIKMYSTKNINKLENPVSTMKNDIFEIFIINDPIIVINYLLDKKTNKRLLLLILKTILSEKETSEFFRRLNINFEEINKIIESKLSNKYFYLEEKEHNFIYFLEKLELKYFTDDLEEICIFKQHTKPNKLLTDDFCKRKLNFLQEIKNINFSYSKEELDKINSEIETVKKLSIKITL